MIFKLGKKAPRIDRRTLRMADYLVDGLPAPPDSISWYKSVESWGMMDNDTLGDCTCAAVGHGVQVASLNSEEGEYTVPDSLVLSLYENACGYVPGDPNTDQGGVIIDVLNYVRKNNFGPHKMFAYATTDPGDVTHIKQGVAVFGLVDIGLQLPISAQSQIGNLWDVVGDGQSGDSAPGSWGGHSVIVAAYDSVGPTCVTWGALQKMTWNFWSIYVDESYALLDRIWLEGRGGAGSINLPKMESDLQQVTN